MNSEVLERREDLWPALVRDLKYATPPGKTRWGARRLPGWATIKYHWGVSSLIRGVARTATVGGFGMFEFARCCHEILHLAESCGAEVELNGVEHVRDNVPAVFVANHMGSFETLVVGGFIMPFGDVTFVLKESLLRYPVFKHLIRGINPVTVGRINPRDDLQSVLTVGVERLKSGISVVVFPQATRSPVFDMHKFNSIGVKLARKAGVPLVPLAVKTDFVATGRIHKDFGKVDSSRPVRFRFGPPVTVSDRPKETHRRTMDFIAGCLEEWGMPVVRSDESHNAE